VHVGHDRDVPVHHGEARGVAQLLAGVLGDLDAARPGLDGHAGRFELFVAVHGGFLL
jgi:hypothetical protein